MSRGLLETDLGGNKELWECVLKNFRGLSSSMLIVGDPKLQMARLAVESGFTGITVIDRDGVNARGANELGVRTIQAEFPDGWSWEDKVNLVVAKNLVHVLPPRRQATIIRDFQDALVPEGAAFFSTPPGPWDLLLRQNMKNHKIRFQNFALGFLGLVGTGFEVKK